MIKVVTTRQSGVFEKLFRDCDYERARKYLDDLVEPKKDDPRWTVEFYGRNGFQCMAAGREPIIYEIKFD